MRRREQTEVSKRDQGAESLQMSREQLHGGTESRKPGFTGGRKRKSAETCAKFLAAQEAADSPLTDFTVLLAKGKIVMSHRIGPSLFLIYSCYFDFSLCMSLV